MIDFITRTIVAAIVALSTAGGVVAEANAAQVDVVVKKPVVVIKPVVRKPAVVIKRAIRKPVVIVKPFERKQPVIIKPVIRKPVFVVKPVVRKPVVVVKPMLEKPAVVVPSGLCTQAGAIRKATNRGLKRAAVTLITPDRITVVGKMGGVSTKMTFANTASCPSF